MSCELTIDGLAELIEELQQLPAELVGEGGHIVEGWGNSAVADIRSGYGNRPSLRDNVDVVQQAGPFAVGALVRSKSPLAYIYENGTQARHTELGADRGSMPPAHVFIPIMIQKRRAMYAELAEMMEQHGLKVSGDAEA